MTTTTAAQAPPAGAARGARAEVEVVRCRPEQWPVLRRLRLQMLEAEPEMFAERPEHAAARSVDDWRAQARRGAGHGRGEAVWFALTPAGGALGLASAHLTPDGEVVMTALWVDPGHRGRGVAARLVAGVEGWARAHGADRVATWVADRNRPARSLYERLGYRETPVRMALARDGLVEHLVAKRLR
jgi:GNAT superfamily N-acetyltransferase